MSAPAIPEAGGLLRDAQKTSVSFASGPARPEEGRPVAWQRAFEEARRTDYGSWFSEVPTRPAAPTSKPGPALESKRPQAPIRAMPSAEPFRSPLEARGVVPLESMSATAHNERSATDTGSLSAGDSRALSRELAATLSRALSSDVRAAPEALIPSSPSATASGLSSALALPGMNGLLVDRARVEQTDDRRATRDAEATTPLSASRVGLSVSSASESPDPLRLHAEWSADGVRVWLGMGGTDVGSRDALVRQLRRALETRGERLLEVVCNGAVAWTRAGAPPEPLSDLVRSPVLPAHGQVAYFSPRFPKEFP